MALTSIEAKQLIIDFPDRYSSPEALHGLISQIDTQGREGSTKTLLYGNSVDPVRALSATETAVAIAENNADIRTKNHY